VRNFYDGLPTQTRCLTGFVFRAMTTQEGP
jgi:hypothetical protein